MNLYPTIICEFDHFFVLQGPIVIYFNAPNQLAVSRSVRKRPDSHRIDMPGLAPPLQELLQREAPSLSGHTKTESIPAMQ